MIPISVKATARAVTSVVVRGTQSWWNLGAMQLGAVIAFYSIFALAPLLVVGVVIAGAVFGEEAARGQLVERTASVIGAPAAQTMEALILATWRDPGTTLATLLGIVTILLGASGLVVELRNALHKVFNIAFGDASFAAVARARLRALVLVIGFGALLLLSLLATAVLSSVGDLLRQYIGAWVDLTGTIDFAISLVIIALAFAAMLRAIPDQPPAWRSVWIGAVASAFMFALGKYFVGQYVSRTGISSTYGAAGAFVVLIVWLYFSALSLLWGAAVGHEAERQHRSKLAARASATRAATEATLV